MNIYYSRSNNVDDSVMGVHIETFLSQLPAEIRSKVNLSKYERGTTYSPQQLEQADLVIVGMPGMKDDAQIGKGCYSEIEKAKEAGIPVIVLHIDTDCSDKILAQTFNLGDLRIENSGDYEAYGSLNLYGSDEGDRYLTKNTRAADNTCYVFPIENQSQVHLFISKFVQELPEVEQKYKDMYDFDDELVFVVNGEKYQASISGDWLEIEGIGNMDFFEKLGFVSEQHLGRYLRELLVGYPTVHYDDVNHWPMRNQEAMNLVINSFMQMAKDTNFHASNQATVDDSAYVPKYQFDSIITINDYELRVGYDWLSCISNDTANFYLSLGFNTLDDARDWVISLYNGNTRYGLSTTYDWKNEKMKDDFIDVLYERADIISRAPRHFVQPVESNYSHSSVEDDDDLLLLM